MNFSEFKKLLGAEPRSRDPEFLRALDSEPSYRAAAREAAEFESRLEAAFAIDVPPELLERLAGIPEQFEPEAAPPSRSAWRWLAAAAVVVAGIGIASVRWYESTFEWDSVNDYLADHWAVDGAELLAQADGQPVERATAARLFARYGVEISPELAGRIDLLHNCKTPGGRGAHMVIITDQGPVTLIFMPKMESVESHILAFDHLVAATLELDQGSAVIIGTTEEIIAPVYAIARSGIRPVSQTS